jgi:hypothetical protein
MTLLMILSAALWLPRLRGPLDLRYDSGVYYILGTSLAEGKGYRLLNEPGEIQAIQYPPLLPLFAAAHQRLAGTADPAVAGHMLRLSFFVLCMGFIVSTYLWSRRVLGLDIAFLVSLLTMLQIHTTWLSDLFFAELPFALASVLFLLTVQMKSRAKEWLGGVVAAMCFLLRTSGIALLAVWVSESLLKREFRHFAFRLGFALVPVLAWQGYVWHVTHGAEYARPAYEYQRAAYQFHNVGYFENLAYVDPFTPELGGASASMWVRRLIANGRALPEGLGAAVGVRRQWLTGWVRPIERRLGSLSAFTYIGEVLLGVLVVVGLVILASRTHYLIVLYVAGSLALMCLTPWPGQFERYLWPLTPILAAALLAALHVIWQRSYTLHEGWKRSAAKAIVMAIVLGILSSQMLALKQTLGFLSSSVPYKTAGGEQGEYTLLFYTGDWQEHDKTLEWLQGRLKPGEIVATSTPHWVYLKTGAQSVMPPFERDVDKAQRLMDSVPVQYVVVDNLEFIDVSQRYSAPVVEAFPERWKLIYSSPKKDSMVFERTRGKDGVGHPILAESSLR